MYILKDNLVIALETAIKLRQNYEKNVLLYSGESALVAGWKEVLESLNKGEEVIIKNEP